MDRQGCTGRGKSIRKGCEAPSLSGLDRNISELESVSSSQRALFSFVNIPKQLYFKQSMNINTPLSPSHCHGESSGREYLWPEDVKHVMFGTKRDQTTQD